MRVLVASYYLERGFLPLEFLPDAHDFFAGERHYQAAEQG